MINIFFNMDFDTNINTEVPVFYLNCEAAPSPSIYNNGVMCHIIYLMAKFVDKLRSVNPSFMPVRARP